MSKSNEKETNSMLSSRKYVLALLILIIGSVLCGLPPILSMFVFKQAVPLIVLSGSEWVTIITLLSGAYFGANVAQKKLLLPAQSQATDSEKKDEETSGLDK